jgi:probable rRNA maturation factor
MKLIINNQYPEYRLSLQQVRLLYRAAKATLATENGGLPKSIEISLSLVGKDQIQELNREYRDKDKITDVLSFPMYMTLKNVWPHSSLGDIVICMPVMRQQAQEYGHSETRELCFLFVHGLLHLCGYDHERSKEEEALQFARQDQVLQMIDVNR